MIVVVCWSFSSTSNFQEAVSMTKPIPDPEDAAKRLLQEANQRGSGDNITIVVVRFLAVEEESSQAAQ